MAFMSTTERRKEHITIDSITDIYVDIKTIEKKLTSFFAHYDVSPCSDSQKESINNYQRILMDIISAVKHIKDIS